MNAAAVLQLVLQLVALFPTLEPAFVQAVKDFEAMFASGNTPSQAEIDALLARVQTQSQIIQSED
jgi:hypothetical protein